MRVIATNRGYDNVTTREPGDEFDMPEGAKGSWFRRVGEALPEPAAEPVQGKKAPRTMSEAAGVTQVGLKKQPAAVDLA